VGIYDDKLRLQRRYEIDIDTDPDSDLDVAASDPGWITDAIWMENSKHMIYTSSLRSGAIERVLDSIPLSFLNIHCKKGYRFSPSPAGMSLTKLSLAGSNLIIPGQREFGK
jgi:hypothetical protein